MEGGGPGASGRNIWIKQARKEDGDLPPGYDPNSSDPPEPREIDIGGKASIWMGKGDRMVIETPAGGAWGSVVESVDGGMEDVAVGTEEGAVVGWAARGSIADRAAIQASF